jgi:hypothetical protein
VSVGDGKSKQWFNFFFTGIRRYVRSMAVNTEDIKYEQIQQRKQLAEIKIKLSRAGQSESDDHRLPVFEKSLLLPLKTVEEFLEFEQKLADDSTRKYLVCFPHSFDVLPREEHVHLWFYRLCLLY